jgi:probable HAF family extracellular repeat protein
MIKLKQATTVALLAMGLILSGPSWALSYNLALLEGDRDNTFFNVYFTDINNAGQIVGGSFYYNSDAALWDGATRTNLGGSDSGTATAINNAGQVILGHSGYTSIGPRHATLWNGATMADLGTLLGGTSSVARDINDAGLVVGDSQTSNQSITHATVWYSNIAHDVGTLGGTNSYAYDINEAGQVVGHSQTTGDQANHATLWNGTTTVTDLGTLLGGSSSRASAINEAGLVVGSSGITGDQAAHATLWDGDTAIDLNSFLDPSLLADGWFLEDATGINDKGWIVGNARNYGKIGIVN